MYTIDITDQDVNAVVSQSRAADAAEETGRLMKSNELKGGTIDQTRTVNMQ